MDIDSALKVADGEDIRNRCHVNSNEDGDRFVGVKADSDKAMVYFPIGYQLPETDQEISVAHAARGPARDEAHGAFLEGDVLLVQDLGKVLHEGVLAQMAEDEMLAAADDGDGELVRLGGGEDEDHARGRLLQRLEQGIEGAAREHVGRFS